MSPDRFAALPEPPCYAVIFASQRNGQADAGYASAAAHMATLPAQQPGYLGAESVRDADGFGITAACWRSEADIPAWKQHAEHAAVRTQGRRDWYAHDDLRVAKVERTCGMPVRA